MAEILDELNTIPFGPLGIIALPGCEEICKKVDRYIVNWREARDIEHKYNLAFSGYHKTSYIIDVTFNRFGTGEGKAVIHESVRGFDVFIICDMFNYGISFMMYGREYFMSPDDHYANLKRAISAIGGKARRITVIMPMLYEGRQHKRSRRESLDCAISLQELCHMGVDNIITFDAHDARVQNAIPLKGFENVQPTYQMVKALTKNVPNIRFDPEHLMIISPDEGGMSRCIYYSTVLGLQLGMFYKRRDYSRVVQGRNPILAHEYLGANLDGKDCLVIDDMISSGDSMLEVAGKLKELNANRIFICTSFGLFCNGLETFDEAYEAGIFTKVFTTNLVYRNPELLSREWYCEVDMSKYLSYIVDTLNHDVSVSHLLNPADKIYIRLAEHKAKQKEDGLFDEQITMIN